MEIALQEITFKTDEVTLIDTISCRIPQGSSVLVMGPSGSGKTLFMKIMAGIIPPSSGHVRFDGKSLFSMSDRGIEKNRLRQGFVFQDAALWQNLSVYNNLALPVQYHHPHRSQAEIRSRIEMLCRAMGFREDLNQRPALLSAGERKVVSIIRALMLDPETIFMDEPSGGLDAAASDRLIELLKDLKGRGKTLVIASHDSEIASLFADRILVIDTGRLLAFDVVDKLVRTDDKRVREILADVFDLSSTYDKDILDILGSSDYDPFT